MVFVEKNQSEQQIIYVIFLLQINIFLNITDKKEETVSHKQ